MIFVSYKSDDIMTVRPMVEHWMANGASLWFNEYSVHHHEQELFQHRINQGIDQSNCAVLFLSRAYGNSSYCHVEVERILRKLGTDKVYLVKLSEADNFFELYPELAENLSIPLDNHGLCGGLMELQPEEFPLAGDYTPLISRGDSQTWKQQEAAFSLGFSEEWNLDFSSQFQGFIRREELDFSDIGRTGFHRFEAKLNGIETELLFDYGYYRGEGGDSVSQRFDDASREMDFQQDERKRLLEEMGRYSQEVERSLDLISGANPERKDLKARELGVHMFVLKDRDIPFKHRVFTFAVESLGAICRTYKLVFQHPQRKKAFTVRLIFLARSDMASFSSILPALDCIVKSFRWLTTYSEVPDIDELKKMHQRFMSGE